MSGALSSFGAVGSLASGGGLNLEQNFSTLPVANIRVCLYTLTIRAPDSKFSNVMSYSFPLSPQALRKDVVALTGLHDVQGAASSQGVARLADQFGLSQPIYTIEGTTGWRTHSTDAFLYNGLSSLLRVEALLQKFATLNQQQMVARNPKLYRLEFYDYFKNDFYEVVPVGPQGFRQSAQSPLLSYYSFRLAALRPVKTPLGVVADTLIAKLFGVAALSAIGQVSSLCGSLASAGPDTSAASYTSAASNVSANGLHVGGT